MTQRSILAGSVPQVTVRAGADARVRGWDSDRVSAETQGRWGLQVERSHEGIEVKLGGSGDVFIPFGSDLRVYTGKDSDVQEIHGEVTVYAGANLALKGVGRLVHATAGKSMDIDCNSLVKTEVKFSAGGDLRCHIRDLTSARILVSDLGGKWEAMIGDGQVSLVLQAGGDVTLVTDQVVHPLPPDYVLGKVEKPEG